MQWHTCFFSFLAFRQEKPFLPDKKNTICVNFGCPECITMAIFFQSVWKIEKATNAKSPDR